MALIADPVTLNDVTVLLPAGCGSFCDPQVKPVFATVSTLEAGPVTAHMYINTEGGELEEFDKVPLTLWATGAANAVIGFDQFIVIVSTGETAIKYTDDRGTTQIEIDQTVVTDWAAHAPKHIDAIDMTYIIICGADGYLWKSEDAARTWETIETGIATTDALVRVEIARDNPQVIYSIGATSAIIKSTNGGETWAQTLTNPGTALLALWVKDQNHILVGDDAGGIYESSDGGATWTAQVAPPDWIAAHDIMDICGCSECGVAWMAVKEAAGSAHIVYRNVDGGASGRWYIPTGGDDTTHPVLAVAHSCANRALAVGGNGTTDGCAILLA